MHADLTTEALARHEMRSIIQRVATGPELSKDIALDEARRGMAATGLSAIAGEPGPAYDSLLLAGALVLSQPGHEATLDAAGERVRGVLHSGRAAARIA